MRKHCPIYDWFGTVTIFYNKKENHKRCSRTGCTFLVVLPNGKEADTGKGLSFPKGIRFYTKYILPVIILIIYYKGYYDTFADRDMVTRVFWMGVACLFVGFIFYCASGKALGLNEKKATE